MLIFFYRRYDTKLSRSDIWQIGIEKVTQATLWIMDRTKEGWKKKAIIQKKEKTIIQVRD